jgi:CDGSH iron-sulfur domain-containing protein 3
MATEPQCPQKAPYVKSETAGDKWWCACGRSKKQPYCDGSHAGTGISPMRVTIEAPKTVAWCGCKKTANAPWCDGAHKQA